MIFFTTLKSAAYNDTGGVNLTKIENTISYSTMEDVTNHDFTGEILNNYKLTFDDINDTLDFENMITIKAIVEKKVINGKKEFQLEVFVSGKPAQDWASQHSGNLSKYLFNNPIRFMSLDDAGFTYNTTEDPSKDTIEYSLIDDLGEFAYKMKKYLFTNTGAEKYNSRIYTFFAFYLPSKIAPGKGAFIMTNVHFWPIGEPSTIVAKLDKNENLTEGPYVLPAEYLIEPEAFIVDYANRTSPYKDLGYPAGKLEKFFTIDSGNGEKILFMQGAGYEEFGNHPYIPLEEEEPATLKMGALEKSFTCEVDKKSNVAFAGSPKLDKFMNQLKLPQAYVINFDNITDISGTAMLEIKENDFVRKSSISKLPISVTSQKITELSCDIILDKGHWIPNTGALLKGITVDLPMKLNNTITDKDWNVTLLPPKDPNFREADINNDGNNIYNNKGCGIIVYAVFDNNSIELVRFTPVAIPAADAAYTPVYNGAYFDATGRVKADGAGLQRTGATGRLRFTYDDNGTSRSTEEFAVKVITDAPAGSRQHPRPGDDFLLQFEMADFTSNNTVEAGVEDFVAIFDFKLLWRAELYIDETKIAETGVDSGIIDWNDANPWHQPNINERNYNDWDLNGDGGQCVIQPWTRPYDENNGMFQYEDDFDNPILNEFSSVAYTHRGRDSVADFNNDMIDQRTALRHYIENPAYNTTLAPEDNPDPTIDNNWRNYINFNSEYTIGGIAAAVDTAQYQPYRPVFSSIYLHYIDGFLFSGINFPALPTAEERTAEMKKYETFSAGVECIGFTQQAASYSGNIYLYPDLEDRGGWGSEFYRDGAYPTGTYKWTIWTAGNDVNLRNFIVPGDMLLMDGHAAIISKVVYANNTRTLSLVDVKIIEATSPKFDYRIINTRSLNYFLTNPDGWINNLQIIRLSTN